MAVKLAEGTAEVEGLLLLRSSKYFQFQLLASSDSLLTTNGNRFIKKQRTAKVGEWKSNSSAAG